jgi:hypothetical protein
MSHYSTRVPHVPREDPALSNPLQWLFGVVLQGKRGVHSMSLTDSLCPCCFRCGSGRGAVTSFITRGRFVSQAQDSAAQRQGIGAPGQPGKHAPGGSMAQVARQVMNQSWEPFPAARNYDFPKKGFSSMKRSDMICSACVKFDGSDCRLNPESHRVTDPQTHWCAQGQWREWSERYQEMEPYYWGEWEEQPFLN